MSAIGMPAALLALFAPRPALPSLPAIPQKGFACHNGLSDCLHYFETTQPIKQEKYISPIELKLEKKRKRIEEQKKKLNEQISQYNPFLDPENKKTLVPEKTLFVGRLSYDTTVKTLLKLFETCGKIQDIHMVYDLNGKPRGYAFIEYKDVKSLNTAYWTLNNKEVNGRAIVVDVERARTVPGWLPRRLGYGVGPGRCRKKEVKYKKRQDIGNNNVERKREKNFFDHKRSIRDRNNDYNDRKPNNYRYKYRKSNNYSRNY